MKDLTQEELEVLATAKGFRLKEAHPGVFYLFFDGEKPAINPKHMLPGFYGLKEVQRYLKSKASDKPTNVHRVRL